MMIFSEGRTLNITITFIPEMQYTHNWRFLYLLTADNTRGYKKRQYFFLRDHQHPGKRVIVVSVVVVNLVKYKFLY